MTVTWKTGNKTRTTRRSGTMNAMRMLTNKWILGLGVGILIAAAASVSQAAPPGRDGRGDGFRGDRDNGRPAIVERDRNDGRDRNMDRDRGGDRGREFSPAWRGGFEPGRDGGFAPAVVRTPVVCGGVGPAGVQVIGGMPGLSININIR
jgi:hypothetical protein